MVVLITAPAPPLQKTDERIEDGGKDAEQKNRHQKPIHFKYLTCVDDQVTKPFFGGKKFADDNADQTEPDVDFHITDDGRK